MNWNEFHNPMARAKFTIPSLVRTEGELKPEIMTFHRQSTGSGFRIVIILENSRSAVPLLRDPLWKS